jgi:HAD superfamily hydrolase (TIGR01484 family)
MVQSKATLMRPIADLPAVALAGIRGLFCDIDDTLTTEGHLTAEAYGALERLQTAGLRVIPITGRPAGWCDHIARMWPVDAVVGENGAFYFTHDTKAKKLIKRFVASDAERAANRQRLRAIGERILREVPGSALASDQLYREADLAIDFCEDVPRLPGAEIDRILVIMEQSGMTAKLSSIHVNGWFGDYDKLGMTKTLMRECFNVDLDKDRDRYLFIGDSPNDAPMFAYFPYSVGVANVRDIESRLPSLPAYITRAKSGSGFAELAALLAATKSGSSAKTAVR